ncbi:MAG: Acylphosphatase, partial [Pseudomonadota bacterium]
ADNSSIESFIKWSNKGPITARVDEVEVSEWPIEEQFTTFEIR